MAKKKVEMDKQNSVASGALAGICSTVVCNPMEVLKTRMSASEAATGVERRLRTQFRALFSKGYAKGWCEGLSSNLVASVPSNAVYLPTYNFTKTYLMRNNTNPNGPVPAHVAAASGFAAVCATNTVLGPLFCIRTRCQIVETRMLPIAKDILYNEGVRGFWRGTPVNIAGRAVEECLFWVLYEWCKKVTNFDASSKNSGTVTALMAMSMGSACKMVGSGISYPYNVLMTHLREVDKRTGVHNHTKAWPTIRYVYTKGGIGGFYKGCSMYMLRSIPSKATQMLVMELYFYNYVKYHEALDEKRAANKRQPPLSPAPAFA